MKAVFFSLTVYVMLVAAAFCAGTADIVQADTLTNSIWERKFGDVNYSYRNRLLATSPADNALSVAGVYSSVAKRKTMIDVEGIWIWKINENGDKITDIRLDNSRLQIDKLNDLQGMAITDKGNIVLLARSETSLSYFLKISSKGEVLLSKLVDNSMQVTNIITTLDKCYVLVGSQKADACIVKIDENGVILWKKIFTRGKSDMFVDGVAVEDGSYVMVENIGKFEKFFMGSSDIWLLKCDANGQKQNELTFSGRYGSIVRTINGGYAVLYDRSNTVLQNIWLKTFDENFKELAEINVTSTDWGLERFKIKSLPSGDLIVGGAVNLRPWISRFYLTGVMKAHFDGKAMEPAIGTAFELSRNNIYIVSSIVEMNEQSQPVNKIKVVKIQL